MPGVVCSACQHAVNVPFTRGTRLADISCPGCGAKKLHVPRPAGARTTAGRSYETCVACGKRGLGHLRRPYEWVPKHPAGDDDPEPYPAGTPCCWICEPVPAARASWPRVIRDLEERLGPAGSRWPGEAAEAALGEIARLAPARCPVCAAAGRSRESVYADDGDFSAIQAHQFERGTALLGHCWDCGHTLELAALRPGGPYVATVTEPAQGLLWEPLHWAATIRELSPKLGAGEVDLYWAGPAHGRRPWGIPNTWIGTDPGGPQLMRFPGPAAAQAALDSVFAPGSRWELPHGHRVVRIVAVPEPEGRGEA